MSTLRQGLAPQRALASASQPASSRDTSSSRPEQGRAVLSRLAEDLR
jgi:hypothetical protein